GKRPPRRPETGGVMRQPLLIEYGPGYETWTEAQFQKVLQYEEGPRYGWIHSHHETFSMGTKPGFPDLTMWNPTEDGVIFLEVKGPRNKVYQDQVDTVQSMRR